MESTAFARDGSLCVLILHSKKSHPLPWFRLKKNLQLDRKYHKDRAVIKFKIEQEGANYWENSKNRPTASQSKREAPRKFQLLLSRKIALASKRTVSKKSWWSLCQRVHQRRLSLSSIQKIGLQNVRYQGRFAWYDGYWCFQSGQSYGSSRSASICKCPLSRPAYPCCSPTFRLHSTKLRQSWRLWSSLWLALLKLQQSGTYSASIILFTEWRHQFSFLSIFV